MANAYQKNTNPPAALMIDKPFYARLAFYKELQFSAGTVRMFTINTDSNGSQTIPPKKDL